MGSTMAFCGHSGGASGIYGVEMLGGKNLRFIATVDPQGTSLDFIPNPIPNLPQITSCSARNQKHHTWVHASPGDVGHRSESAGGSCCQFDFGAPSPDAEFSCF